MVGRSPARDLSFRLMSLIHDNPLRRLFDDPVETLRAAGVQPGQQVLEVGCGPGYFTIPAADLVGSQGCVYALDLHPLAIQAVEGKARKAGLANVRTVIADAAETGLPANSIDLVLLFGVIHRLPLARVLPEVHRVLRQDGALAVRAFSPGVEERLVKDGLLTFVGREGRVLNFRKSTAA